MKGMAGFLLLLVMVLTACSGTKVMDATSWTMLTLNGQSALTDVQVTMIFMDGKVGGSDGCNSYSGSYKENGGKLTFGKDFMSTMMACSEPIMGQSTSFINTLTQTASSKVEADQLTLFDKEGKELAVFTKQITELSGTAWIVIALSNGNDAVETILTGTEISLAFGADGKVSGSAGCNNYSAKYEMSGLSLEIGQVTSSKTMCTQPDGLMRQEAAFLNALGKIASFRLDGEKLNLLDQNGAILLSLQQ